MIPILEIIEGPLDGLQFKLTDSSDIGFNNRNAIIFYHDQTVSKYHACIDLEGPDWFLVDLESRNGTYINYSLGRLKPYKKFQLTNNCFFCIGATIVQFFFIHENEFLPISDYQKDIRDAFTFNDDFSGIWDEFYTDGKSFMDTTTLSGKCISRMGGSVVYESDFIKNAFSNNRYMILESWINKFRNKHHPSHQPIIGKNIVAPRIWRILKIIQKKKSIICMFDFLEGVIQEGRSIVGRHIVKDPSFLKKIKNGRIKKPVEETTVPSTLEYTDIYKTKTNDKPKQNDLNFLINQLVSIEDAIASFCKQFQDFTLKTNYLPHLNHNLSHIAFSKEGDLEKENIALHVKEIIKVLSILIISENKESLLISLKNQLINQLAAHCSEDTCRNVEMLMDDYIRNENMMIKDHIEYQLKNLRSSESQQYFRINRERNVNEL